jgi:transcriptional regulator with GAF, ATPase, and Fis domain
MHPRILAITGSLTGTVRPLVEGPLSIGRDDTNHLCLIDPTVSPIHCTLTQTGDRYELVDHDSHNGTFVNGIPVHRKFVEHGDTIRVGQSELIFLLEEDERTPNSVRVSHEPSVSAINARSVDHPAVIPTFDIQVGHMARDLVALFRITNVINSVRDSRLLQQELLRLIFEVVPADSGAVVLLEDLDGEPTSVCTHHRKLGENQPVDVQIDLVHHTLWERSTVFTDVPAASGEAIHIICVPLVAVERTIGVIYLASPHPSPPFHEDHIHFLDSVSRIVAVTLENILALDALRSENRSLKEEINPARTLIGESRQILQIEDFISRVAHTDSTVLIRGESGTGKEMVARAIHHRSPRTDRPFIAINCAAIPETLLESELFGHEKGAFTGAVGMRKGKLEAASDGTVFFDEIGELAPALQAKLLRVLQQREFERVGGTQSVLFKARVLAATNKNLEQAIKSNEFRQDLYYRLNVVSVTTPPLREHREDIPLLSLYFASVCAQKCKRSFKGISSRARALLIGYSWPGNVRELENAIEHAIVLGLTDEILPEDLPANILEQQTTGLTGARYHDVLNQAKKEMILNALHEAKGSYPEAARLLNLHPKYLHRLARNLNLKPGPG